MDNVSGQRDSLYKEAISNHNMRGYFTGQVRILVTQLPFAGHHVLFRVRRDNAERGRLLEWFHSVVGGTVLQKLDF